MVVQGLISCQTQFKFQLRLGLGFDNNSHLNRKWVNDCFNIPIGKPSETARLRYIVLVLILIYPQNMITILGGIFYNIMLIFCLHHCHNRNKEQAKSSLKAQQILFYSGQDSNTHGISLWAFSTHFQLGPMLNTKIGLNHPPTYHELLGHF